MLLSDMADLMEKVHLAERDAMSHLLVVVAPEEKDSVRAMLDDAGYNCLRLASHPSIAPGGAVIRRWEPLTSVQEEPPEISILDTHVRKPLWKRILESI